MMPGDYTDNSFTECDGDSAYPPGWYPQANGSTSTFQQRYTGTFTNADGSLGTWTQGQTVTPQSAYSVPATSNCKTYTSVGNGISSLALSNAGSVNSTAGSSSSSGSSSGNSPAAATGSSSSGGSGASGSANAGSTAAASASGSSSKSAAMSSFSGVNYGSAMAGAISVVALVAGAGTFLL